MVHSTRGFVVCLSVCHFVLVVFSPFSIAITSLGEERANLSAFRTFVRFVLVWICRFPLPLGLGGRVVRRCRVSYVTRASNLILAYSWTRPAILVAGKGRGGMFLFLLFLHYHSCSSFFPVPLFHLLYYLFYIFSPFLWETTQNDPQGVTCR